MKGILSVIIVILGLYVVVCLLGFVFQRTLLYAPTPEPELPAENVEALQVPGATLRLTVKKRAGPNALIYFGGNAQDVAASLDRYEEWFPHHSIYMLHYRGYGGSTGFPTERHLYADALAVYEHVKRRHENITILGRSLGSALAVRVTSLNPVARLILVTPFDSIKNVAQQAYPFLPVSLILRDRYETIADAAKIKSPTLLIGASEDNIVRPERTVALMNAMNDNVTELIWIESAGHNTISFSPEYEKLMRDIGRSEVGN